MVIAAWIIIALALALMFFALILGGSDAGVQHKVMSKIASVHPWLDRLMKNISRPD